MEVAMKTLLIAFTAVSLAAGGALAVMNKACKSSHHVWCAPASAHFSTILRSKTGPS
jgi:hypothetical protein